jgi:hypothetical protein
MQLAFIAAGALVGFGITRLVDGNVVVGSIAGGFVGVVVGFVWIIRKFQDAMHEFDHETELPPAAGDDDG